MDIITRHEWQASEYHQNSGVQQEAAMHLLNVLNLSGNEKVLDVGCGDGKITAALANSLRKGSILGIDASEEMITFACNKFLPSKNNNLNFIFQDADSIDYTEQFDIIFSSFVLQWVLNIETFFQKAHRSLKQNGKIACTIPLSISDALEQSLAFLIKKPQWSSYFKGFTLNYYLRDKNFYSNILSKSGFTKTHFEVVDQEWLFPSRFHFEQYTLMWLPHLDVLPEQSREEFFNQLMDKYVELVPLRSDGKLSFIFGRVDFIAKRNPIL